MGRSHPTPAAFAALALISAAATASAAPTCQTAAGQTIRCGEPAAMPVGWRLPDEQRMAQRSREDGPSATQIAGLIAFLAGFFGLIALMPDFDGASDRDWDAQEDDDRRQVG